MHFLSQHHVSAESRRNNNHKSSNNMPPSSRASIALIGLMMAKEVEEDSRRIGEEQSRPS